MGLQIAIRHAGDVTILDLQGRATIGPTNDSLSANLRKLIDGGESKILLNLAGATQIDSSSISTIVRAFVSLRGRGANLKLLSPRGNVKLVLEMLRLLNVIPNFDDEAEALISFESAKPAPTDCPLLVQVPVSRRASQVTSHKLRVTNFCSRAKNFFCFHPCARLCRAVLQRRKFFCNDC